MGDARSWTGRELNDLRDRAVARRVASDPAVQARARAVVLVLDARDRALVRLLLEAHRSGVGEDGLASILATTRAILEETFEEHVRRVMADLAAAEGEAEGGT